MEKEIFFILGLIALLLTTSLAALIDNSIQCRRLIKELREDFYYEK